MSDDLIQTPREAESEVPNEASPPPEEREFLGSFDKAKTKAREKVARGQADLAEVEDKETNGHFEINNENLDRWTVVMDEHLKELLGKEYSSDHLFVTLRLLKQKRFNGQNLFEAMKKEVTDKDTVTFHITEENLMEIRDATRKIVEDRELIAEDWKRFLHKKTGENIEAIAHKHFVEEDMQGQAISNVERENSSLSLETDRELFKWNAKIFDSLLEPGEALRFNMKSGAVLYYIKAKNGEFLINGVSFNDIDKALRNQEKIPGLKIDLSEFRIIDYWNDYEIIIIRLLKAYGRDMEAAAREITTLHENTFTQQYFEKVEQIVEKYNCPLFYNLKIEIPFHGALYKVDLTVKKTEAGWLINTNPSYTTKDEKTQSYGSYFPPEFLARLVEFDLNAIYPNMRSFGEKIIKAFSRE